MNNNENGSALICIPDINGFTRFMAENKIEFSRKIIPPLLRTIVSSNSLNMKVGEIEGDAVVFYRFGLLPTLRELVEQCVQIYDNFNTSLTDLLTEYAPDFEKYESSNRLSLKIIVHAAEIVSTHIEGFPKLIGEDMVVVHKLLKNSVNIPEYMLVTEKLLKKYSMEEIKNVFAPRSLHRGQDDYEFIGNIKYRYVPFSKLKRETNEQKDVPVR